MDLKVYNVLTRKKEKFVPKDPKNIKMYACGITVSGDAHIGHAYQAIIFDTIRKYLRYLGYNVTYVRNYTDVDDKIINNARKENEDPLVFAQRYINKTDKELDALGIERPTITARATDCINDMIDFISKLIEKGYAYTTESGNVYFRVSKFNNYGSFSNRMVEDGLIGVRKEVEPGKEDDRDFALWKSAGSDEIFWNSPFGKGRPGWHIECSTMAMKFLGETLDIHGGGKDLIFPHHENEIAQSEALSGKQFSRYWLHNGLVKVNGQKMSKSLGNGILLEDLLNNYNSDTIRLTLLQNNYRSDINIVDRTFESSEQKIYKIYKLFKIINNTNKDIVPDKDSIYFKKIETDFCKAMDNDFNAALAIANCFTYIDEINKLLKSPDNLKQIVDMKYAISNIYNVLGLFDLNPEKVIEDTRNKYIRLNSTSINEIEELINLRNSYKLKKDFLSSDKIRDELLNKGIIIKDTKEGTGWDIDFTVHNILADNSKTINIDANKM